MDQALIRRVAFVIVACRVPFDQPHEHPDDSLKTFFSWVNLLRRQLRLGYQNVQPSGAFERRAMGDIKKPAAILRRVFAVALGDIQRDRSGCPVQLIFDFTDSHRSVQERREPCNEGNRFLIDFQSFVIEAAFFGRVHEVRLLILIVLLILFVVVIFLQSYSSLETCRGHSAVGPIYPSIEG